MKKEHEVMTTVELKNFLRMGYENTVRLLEQRIIPSVKINNRGDRRILREDAVNFVRGNSTQTH